MRWAFRIGRIGGVAIDVHAGFLLLLVWIAWLYARAGSGPAEAFEGAVFTVAVFLSVLAHELGHAFAARRCGIGTFEITLLPFGGLARLERPPERPRDELGIALAGPGVNVALAAGLLLWLGVGSSAGAGDPLVQRLLLANVFLGFFNLLPAFPMDGGRVLRALLALRLPYASATGFATRLGQSIALLMAGSGVVLANPFLILLALFIWFGAAAEASRVRQDPARSSLELDPIPAPERAPAEP